MGSYLATKRLCPTSSSAARQLALEHCRGCSLFENPCWEQGRGKSLRCPALATCSLHQPPNVQSCAVYGTDEIMCQFWLLQQCTFHLGFLCFHTVLVFNSRPGSNIIIIHMMDLTNRYSQSFAKRPISVEESALASEIGQGHLLVVLRNRMHWFK